MAKGKKKGRTLVKFSSHRARDNGLRMLDRKPMGLCSLGRETGHGVYVVTPAELAMLKERTNKKSTVTKFKDGSDLFKCWGRS